MRSIHHVEWQKAIDAEIQSLLKLNTWIVVDKPLYKKCLTGAFIFKKKYVGNCVVLNTKLVLLYMVLDNDMVKTTGRRMLQSPAIVLSKLSSP
jgi:hypothetical protein